MMALIHVDDVYLDVLFSNKLITGKTQNAFNIWTFWLYTIYIKKTIFRLIVVSKLYYYGINKFWGKYYGRIL